MRLVISILLMLSLTYQCTVQLGVLAWYEMNKEFISKNLCINRDKPKMGCNGKCQLNKQLHKADSENTTGKQVPGKNHKAEFTDLLVPDVIHYTFHLPASEPIYNPTIPHMGDDGPRPEVFHPPAFG